jgi:hypothetical protein
MTSQQQQLKTGSLSPGIWTPQSDIQIANKVLIHAGY